NRSVGADPECERQHSDYSENRTMDQCPQTGSDVSPDGFYKATHSNLPHSFFNLLDPAKLDESVTPSLLRRQALSEFRFRQHVQVCLDFFTELLVHSLLVEEVAPETGQARNQRHDCVSSGGL